MKVYNIVITAPAEADLQGIINYISNELRDINAARNILSNISSAIIDLELFPSRNNLVNDERLALIGIRMLVVASYIVFYIVSKQKENVTIIRILNSRRDWLNLLQ